jgi:hypothetical protein
MFSEKNKDVKDVRKFMRCKKLYKFFTSKRKNFAEYSNLCKKITNLYGEYNFKKIILLATQIEDHPEECWDVELIKNKSLYSRCLNYYLKQIKNLKYIEGRRNRRLESEKIDSFIFAWSG